MKRNSYNLPNITQDSREQPGKKKKKDIQNLEREEKRDTTKIEKELQQN